jgi:hypothetical protein
MCGSDKGPCHLEILSFFAEEDSRKIQKLAVDGHWDLNDGWNREERFRQALVKSVKLFTGLKELVVYHTNVPPRLSFRH